MNPGLVFGLTALLLVQLGFVAAVLYLYFRIRTQADHGNADRASWAAKIELAVTTADSAKRQVEDIEVEHYRKLRALYESQTADLAECKTEVSILKGKLASEERMERRRRQKEAPQEGDEGTTEGAPNAAALEKLKKLGIAIPLQPQPPVTPAQPARRFGLPP